ncbi:hypothetical protein MHBO_002216 [Bonamia ostreae]|uniref:Uncharacterized protein n=1 Tax=Bonamia ostreae TaxID=126728 RepID=A0ABV2ALP2_9EUKA
MSEAFMISFCFLLQMISSDRLDFITFTSFVSPKTVSIEFEPLSPRFVECVATLKFSKENVVVTTRFDLCQTNSTPLSRLQFFEGYVTRPRYRYVIEIIKATDIPVYIGKSRFNLTDFAVFENFVEDVDGFKVHSKSNFSSEIFGFSIKFKKIEENIVKWEKWRKNNIGNVVKNNGKMSKNDFKNFPIKYFNFNNVIFENKIALGRKINGDREQFCFVGIFLLCAIFAILILIPVDILLLCKILKIK